MQSGDGFPFMSTGQLPTPEAITVLVDDAHARFMSNNEGATSQVYPALAQVPGDLFGVCVVSICGNVYEVGDTQYEFSIMSVSKPFVFALVCQSVGAQETRDKLGANLDNINFVSNDRLQSALERTTATPQQVAEAVRINTEARLRALKIGLLIMPGLALITIIPAGQLPHYIPGDLPSDLPSTGRQ
jgi:Glutaminase